MQMSSWSAEAGMHGNEGIGALSLVFHPLEGMEVLRAIPQDGTFDRTRPLGRLAHLKEFFSFACRLCAASLSTFRAS